MQQHGWVCYKRCWTKEAGHKRTLYYFSYTKFKNRRNWLMALEVRIVVMLEGLVTEKGPSMLLRTWQCSLLDLEVAWVCSICENSCFVNIPVCYTSVIQLFFKYTPMYFFKVSITVSSIHNIFGHLLGHVWLVIVQLAFNLFCFFVLWMIYRASNGPFRKLLSSSIWSVFPFLAVVPVVAWLLVLNLWGLQISERWFD